MTMARLVGINHVALEIGDLEEALSWYRRFLEFEVRGRAAGRMAFLDIGDQFIALAAGRTQPQDGARHFGLVADDAAVRAAMQQAGVGVQSSGSLDFTIPGATTYTSSITAKSSSPRPRLCSEA
jgi:catechol 2,3-dioxygenase-like lactoylglutathione lyase family enzyme